MHLQEWRFKFIMKKFTFKRIYAFLIAISMMTCMLGFNCHAEASAAGEQADGKVNLAVPQNVQEKDGFIVWDSVVGAYGYTIQACKGDEKWEYNWYENKIEWSRFIYEHCYMGGFGDYEFKVCAFDETGAATEFSSPVTVSYNATFTMPVNVKVSELDSRELTWDAVEGAARYNIRIYKKDEQHSLYGTDYRTDNSYWFPYDNEGEYLVTVQAMDKDYHVSEWTEEVLVKVVPRLEKPQNVRLDESGENIFWDEVEGADYYNVSLGYVSAWCEKPMLENWKKYIYPWNDWYDRKQHISVYAYNGQSSSDWSADLLIEYEPECDKSIAVPQIQIESEDGEDRYITWDEAENAFRYYYRIKINGDVIEWSYCEKESARRFWIDESYPEGDYEFELCVVDENGRYNSKVFSFTLDTAHDESVWVPKLFCKFGNILWDYDRLRHPDTSKFWVRIRGKNDGTIVKLKYEYDGTFYGLMNLDDGEYTVDVCVCEYDREAGRYKLGNWSDLKEIEKKGYWIIDKENEITTEVETPTEAEVIPEDDRITSITINPASNMKHKDGNNVEIDLSKITIKAKEIYDEEGLKRAEEALGETLNGNKHYNLLDLTLLYDGKDFSNGYEGLVKVIIPLPKGHRDKTFSCYRLIEADSKVTKELIPGEQTEDSYIIYLEHFSEYALVAAEPEETHTHVYGAEWKSDAVGHWKECECKDKTEESTHTQDEGTVTKEATTTETGIKTYKCSVCGYVIKTEEIAKLPADEEPHTHVYGTEWKSDSAGHWKECECKDRAEESTHTQDEGTVTKEATTTETGIKTYKCSVCGYVIKTEKIAKLPKETTNNNTDNVTKEQKRKNDITLNEKISLKVNGNSLAVAWNKLQGADGYDIYAAPCSNSFKGVTVSVGKNKASAVIRKINSMKINGKKAYKVKVKAYRMSNGKKQYIGTSAVMHVVGSLNKKNTNAKNISLKKKTYTIKKGKSIQIHAAAIKADRKKILLSKGHGAKLSYVSSDEKIASVTSTGRIKAKKRGKCIIYVRALNGISKKIKVTVN